MIKTLKSLHLVLLAPTLLLFGGLHLGSHVFPGELSDPSEGLEDAPITLFFLVGVTIYTVEAFIWTIAATEVAARWGRSATGAIVGGLIYGVALHWNAGLTSVLVASWIALVLNTSYVYFRAYSKPLAIMTVLINKLGVLAMAAKAIF